MRRAILSAVALALAFAAGAVETNELEIARQALRDGLWAVARAHAEKAGGDTARLVVLESFASEGRWDEVAKALGPRKEKGDAPGFAYYRAVVDGALDKAAGLLLESGSMAGLAEGRMLEADLRVRRKDRAGAEKLWREVVAMTNAGERALVIASVNLGDEALLREAVAKVRMQPLQRLAGLKLGVLLLGAAKTAAEGEKIIRAIVKDSPDAEGAAEAFVALARAEAAAGEWKDAAKTYADAIEIWPEVAKRFDVQEGRGESFLRLGRRDDALAAFVRAEDLAADDASRALAVLRQGDVLSELGRGEESMARYRQVLEKYPATDVARRLKRVVELRELESKGRELYKEFRFAEAQKTFAAVAEADPSRKPRMDFFCVLCLYGKGDDSEAKARAKAIAAGSPDPDVRAEATLWLAKFTYNRGEWKESVEFFDAFVDLAPAHAFAPEALLWAARAAFVENDFNRAILIVTRLVERYPAAPARFPALSVQGEALIELARFSEAVLVLESVAISESAAEDVRAKARMLKADALFAMGADNPARYQAALEAYRSVRFGGALDPSARISVSFKIARTLEKLKRYDESVDEYYTQVVLAYWNGRLSGEKYDDNARASFSKAAFRLSDEFESRGKDTQALSVLQLVSDSDVPAAEEAEKRIERISRKGRFL